MRLPWVQLKVGEDNPFQNLIQSYNQRLEVPTEDAEIIEEALKEIFKVLRRKDEFTQPRKGG
jgi:hypothetical protein